MATDATWLYCLQTVRANNALQPTFAGANAAELHTLGAHVSPPRMAEQKNPRFQQAVRDSFAAQQLMATIGARLTRVGPGEIEIRVPFRHDLMQQHGFLHAGVVTSALDSACGYAAFSLMQEGAGVLTLEFKTNFLAPARGEELIARGRVVRAGRTINGVSGRGLNAY